MTWSSIVKQRSLSGINVKYSAPVNVGMSDLVGAGCRERAKSKEPLYMRGVNSYNIVRHCLIDIDSKEIMAAKGIL